jgi:hypothetical protein
MIDRDQLTPEQLPDPRTRQRVEALKILIMHVVEEAGEKGISVRELKRRLGISESDLR